MIILGQALVKLSNNKVNVFLNQNYTRNPLPRDNNSDQKTTRFLDVPLTTKLIKEETIDGWMYFPKNGDKGKALNKDIKLNSMGKPFEKIDIW